VNHPIIEKLQQPNKKNFKSPILSIVFKRHLTRTAAAQQGVVDSLLRSLQKMAEISTFSTIFNEIFWLKKIDFFSRKSIQSTKNNSENKPNRLSSFSSSARSIKLDIGEEINSTKMDFVEGNYFFVDRKPFYFISLWARQSCSLHFR
jgi:hypothetical protein